MDHIPEYIRSLSELLQHLDGISGGFRPIELDTALALLSKVHPDAETGSGHAWYDEVAAGGMMLLNGDEEGPWGLDFGPIMQGQSTTGTLLTHPNLERLDLQTLDYWRNRARESTNPVLQARYADLAWVFAEHLGMRKSNEDARIAIDAYLSSLSILPAELEVDAIQNANRAMSLALSLNDASLQLRIKDGMFALARRLESIPFPLRRSFLLDGFGLGPFAMVPLSDEERAYMLRLLEESLEREHSIQTSDSPISIWEAQNAAQLLSAYYRKIDQPTEITRVLIAFGEIVHRRAEQTEPMVGQAWLEGFARLCDEYRHKELATKAIQVLQALGPKVLDGMTRHSHEAQIPKEEMDRFIAQFIQGDLAQALGRVAVNMVPNWDHVVRSTQELSEQAVLTSLIPRTLLDGSGRPIMHMPPFRENPEAHFPMAYGHWIQLEAFFRFHIIEAIRSKYSPTSEDIVEWLLHSPAFRPERRTLLEFGLRAYLAEDHITAIHLFIPQIEEAARTASGLLGDSIFEWKTGADGIRRLDARLLSKVLDNPRLSALLGQNRIMFMRVALVINQGLNLRNRLAHGLLMPEEFNRSLSDVAFQCLLILGTLRRVS